jgi:hypothetical protein
MRYCEKCGHKIKAKLCCYSSGSGALDLVWREDTQAGITLSRKVTKQDCVRYLASERGKHLTDWVPVLMEQRWALVCMVKRTGKNRLKIGDGSYTYELKCPPDCQWHKSDCYQATACNTTFYFTMRVKGKNRKFELKNYSTIMVLRYFLNHEKELTAL